jgi:hypothetical protein
MATDRGVLASPVQREVRVRFLQDPKSDLVWYIGSSSLGWLYVALVVFFGRDLADPIRDPFYRLDLGGTVIPLTLGLVVVTSWSLLIDAPHVFATLARTWLDPDEWALRRKVLLGSLAFFALGPLVVFGPYLAGTLAPLDLATMALPTHLFFVFFRLWAYYHVVRQHWGFLVLYKKKNDDFSDPVENRADWWFFNAALYLPLLLLMTAPWYGETGMPPLGLDAALAGGITLASLLRPVALLAYPLSVGLYLLFQWRRFRQGRPRNGAKLLFLLSIVPLHFIVFSHPLLALFVVPIVTVGHNLQYHRIVWVYGRRKYRESSEPRLRFSRAVFRSVPVYLGLGLAFTFLLYQGPFVELVKAKLAFAFDQWVFEGIGMVAGIARPEESGVGARVVATLFLGWAMQHYYLDSKIWRVRQDPAVARHILD